MNKIYRGAHGTMWFNSVANDYVTEVEAKLTAEFEDITPIGTFKTKKLYKGSKGAGKFVQKKRNSSVMTMIVNAFNSGIMPDVKIITNMAVDGCNERVAVKGITFTEVAIMKIKGQDSIDEEIPFEFEEFEILETI